MENDVKICDFEENGDWMSWHFTENMIENEGLQSVPDDSPSIPFLVEPSAYPPLESSPFWMDLNQNVTNFNSSGSTGENTGNTYSEEPSPAPSSTSSFVFNDYAETFGSMEKHDEQFRDIIARIGVTEQKLQQFGVKELNRFLKSNGLTKEEQQCLKNRRRTLKNRGYAQNCRIKRIKVKKSLESENERLHKELNQMRVDLAKSRKERDIYKEKLKEIVNFLKLQKSVKVA